MRRALVKLSMMSAPRTLSQIAGRSAIRSKNAITPALALVRTPHAPRHYEGLGVGRANDNTTFKSGLRCPRA